MKSILSCQRRAAGVASAVLCSLVFAAACSDDTTVGPRDVSVPATASAVRSTLPTITTEYVDFAKNLVGGGAFQLKDTLGATLLTVVDDAANDGDKTPGKFKLSAAPGVYQLCETMPPPIFNFPAKQKTSCFKVTVAPGSSTHMGPYMVVPPFSAAWATVAGPVPPNVPIYVGPTSFRVSKSDDTFLFTVTDNGLNDIHGTLGMYYVKLPSAGDYTICQIAEIQNHWMPNPACHTFTVTFGTVGWGDYFVNPEKQVYVP
jgi:hypothetical protein